MIYFDNAASTPLCEAAKEILTQDYGNPSSPHALGLEAERALKIAAKQLAGLLFCKSEEIIFTSGGTESNNLGILGAAFALKSARGHKNDLRILASNHEHPSVIEPLNYLASLPGFKVSFTSDFEQDADMICISQVSSETGDIYNIEKSSDAILFVDGAQSFCKIPPPACADIFTFSAHKIHGPMGVGGLMLRKEIRLAPLMYGGGQQNRLRPGTENVSGILAMAAAVSNSFTDSSKIQNIKNIISSLADELPDTHINQVSEKASPYILNISFLGVRGETLTSLLSSRGLCVSMGTACRSAKKESALSAMGFSKQRAESAIRLSFSVMNTEEEAQQAKEIIKASVKELRFEKSTTNKIRRDRSAKRKPRTV